MTTTTETRVRARVSAERAWIRAQRGRLSRGWRGAGLWTGAVVCLMGVAACGGTTVQHTEGRVGRVTGGAQRPSDEVSDAAVTPGESTDDEAPGLRLSERHHLISACEVAEQPGPRRLYRVDVPPGAFVLEDGEDGQLVLPVRRALRVVRGQVEIFPSHMTPWHLSTDPGTARRVRRAASTGGHLRVGFFLGFDEHRKQVCVIRPQSGVTTVRADLAYIDVVSANGALVMRESTERLRAWLDDRPSATEGGTTGPSVRLMYATVAGQGKDTEASAAWLGVLRTQVVLPAQSCLRSAQDARLPRELTVIVQWPVERTGRPGAPTVQLSDLGEGRLDACVRDAIASATFTAEPAMADAALKVRLRFTP